MSQNIVYQLKYDKTVKAEGTVGDCWAELTQRYMNYKVSDLVRKNIRIEPKS